MANARRTLSTVLPRQRSPLEDGGGQRNGALPIEDKAPPTSAVATRQCFARRAVAWIPLSPGPHSRRSLPASADASGLASAASCGRSTSSSPASSSFSSSQGSGSAGARSAATCEKKVREAHAPREDAGDLTEDHGPRRPIPQGAASSVATKPDICERQAH
eukprot:CAMPEP_0176087420 /NCGR_PEP_ID=MMETSP0120_2-20121206/43765_1 /TAXON_ID=160619 /ORGANISM="Kryptoperidinium foliaceum, Strain CCMP 1326" /LENGTH=160 /DNA_ID=CAMNT_0017421263 /DNA_START=37 /DNA_END=515 /DNA_ORIENTATION=-